MTSSCPTMSLRSSRTIASRASRSLSASAMSSAEASVACGSRRETATKDLCRRVRASVRHGVDDVVHTELVRLVRHLDRDESLVGPLPVVTDVVVVVRDQDQSLRRIVVLVHAPELCPCAIVWVHHLERLDVEERV